MDPGPLLFLLGFVLLWCAISAGLSVASGWHGLARYHRAFDAVEGESFRFASGAIGFGAFPVGYNNSLNVTVNRTGFRLAVFPAVPIAGAAAVHFLARRGARSRSSARSPGALRANIVRLRGDGPQIRLARRSRGRDCWTPSRRPGCVDPLSAVQKHAPASPQPATMEANGATITATAATHKAVARA